MKRRLLIAAIFLLAGVVVNVGVAWACAVFSSLNGPVQRGALSDQLARWEVMRWSGFGADRIQWEAVRETWLDGGSDELLHEFRELVNRVHRKRSDGMVKVYAALSDRAIMCEYEYGSHLSPNWGEIRTEDVTSPREWHGRRIEDARGWPALTFWASFDMAGRYGRKTVVGQHHAVALWRHAGSRGFRFPALDVVVIPYSPIWPGLTANTLFYAAALCLLICGPFALRRLIRVKRGLCPKCAYPMGEADVCSECGKELPGHASQRIMATDELCSFD